ncbi:MAG: SH3 domain-containing protein [Pseudoxanthomonas sp.]
MHRIAIMPANRLFSAFALLSLASACCAAEQEFSFNVAPGIVADAHLRDDGSIEVGTNRSPKRQHLQASSDEEGDSSLSHDDYNFDGYQDLESSAVLGQVNEADTIYLYDPASNQFRLLQPPSNAKASCEGFWGVTPDAASKTLTSSCRGGPLWHTDIYRYDGARLYLYRAFREIYMRVEQLQPLLALEQADDLPVLAVWNSYDPHGKRQDHVVGNPLDIPNGTDALHPLGARVVPPHVPLHDRPGDDAKGRYLVAGDQVELLDASDDERWLQVRYRNPTHGAIVGWLEVPQ